MGKLVPTVSTVLSEPEAVYWMKEAWKTLLGEYPKLNQLALLRAQWGLETGHGVHSRCNNMANIKKHFKPDDGHDWCQYDCSEVLNGKEIWFKPPHPQTNFRAYSSPWEGFLDYVKFLSQRTRYKDAWKALLTGDVAAYNKELKKAGFYTAGEEHYLKLLTSISNKFKKNYTKLNEWKPVMDESDLLEDEEDTTAHSPTMLPYEPEEILGENIDNIVKESEEVKPPEWIGLISKIFEFFKKFFK